jgi:hypothetical protein
MEQKIEIKANDESLKGRYSNMVQVVHNKEEFVFDFFMIVPPLGQLTSRIIMSPGHVKRFANAILENIKKYEEVTGKKITESKEPKIGFHLEH